MNPALGRALWTLLHTYAHGFPDTPAERDIEAARSWLTAFNEIVRENSTGCRCAQHWDAILRDEPPDLTSRAHFYWWTVAVHNQVNARLGKPVIALR